MSDDNWVRVTDLDTGHKRTVRESEVPHGNYRVLKADAVDPVSGDPLPAEFNAVKPTPTSTTTADGQTAIEKKE